MKRSVVVTGASTGIGCAIAKLLASEGFHVFARVRRTADADRLDVRDRRGGHAAHARRDGPEAIAEAARRTSRTPRRTGRLAGLVNNAGIATAGPCCTSRSPRSAIRSKSTSIAQVAGHPGLRAAARRRPRTQRAARPHRQHVLGRRPHRCAIPGRLCSFETRARGRCRIRCVANC